MKYVHWAILSVVLTGFSLSAMAQDPQHRIDGDKLQKKAERILEANPDAKQATVRVEVEPVKQPDTRTITVNELDLNQDGVLSRDEVGEKLFKVFDRDGNEVIDNIEMKTPSLLVFSHMEKKVIEIVDYRDQSEEKSVTVEEFLEESKLSRFDKDKDGLSPLDFLRTPFNQVNVKRDGVIDLYEWKRAYAAIVRPKHMEDFNYNH